MPWFNPFSRRGQTPSEAPSAATVDEALQLSRSGHTGPLGKLTTEIKIRTDEDTKDALERLARSAGLSLSEYLRDVLMVHAHGQEYVASLYAARLARVAGTQPGMGNKEGASS